MAALITIANIRHTRTGVYIGRANVRYGLRASPLANPFRLEKGGDRLAALARYRVWLTHQMRLEDSPARAEIWRLVELARTGDVTLLCWCAPSACHGDVVKEVVEGCIRGMEA